MSAQRLGTTLHRLVERLEHAQVLDTPASAARSVAKQVLPESGPVKEALSGSWLGHPAHPFAAMLPIGFYYGATLLDITGQRRAADRLLAAGIASALPAASTGLSDWTDITRGRSRHVGLVHAASNATATTLFTASLVAKKRGNRTRGRAFSAAAHTALGLGGFLGSHMAYVRGVGVNQSTFTERLSDWTPLDGVARVVGDHAVGSHCTHCGTALDDQLECPSDHSLFNRADGAVVRGPATTPLPVFQTRTQNGATEILPLSPA